MKTGAASRSIFSTIDLISQKTSSFDQHSAHARTAFAPCLCKILAGSSRELFQKAFLDKTFAKGVILPAKAAC